MNTHVHTAIWVQVGIEKDAFKMLEGKTISHTLGPSDPFSPSSPWTRELKGDKSNQQNGRKQLTSKVASILNTVKTVLLRMCSNNCQADSEKLAIP